MAGPDASAYLAAVKWGDEGYYLEEFSQKFTLPQVAKIIKGQYLTLGVPSLPSPSLNQIVFVASGGKRVKVAAQCVKFKDGRRVVPVGSKLAIPDNYDGWFEILSEDGRAVRCIESVAELMKRFPETCLVRESIKAYLARTDDLEMVSEKTRTIQAGDTLVLVGEVQGAPLRSKSSGRYLRCFTSKGETVFLSVDQRGKFSPVAKEDNISGVHTMKNLLTKRFPLMVRLVHGKTPAGLKSNSQFVTEMRLYSLFEEESIVALPLLKDSQIVFLPPTAPLKVQAPKNCEALVKLKEYSSLVEKCKSMMQEVSDRIQVFDISLSKELRIETKNIQPNVQNQRSSKNISYMHRVKRSLSDPRDKHKENMKPDLLPAIHGTSSDEDKPISRDENYDEIDQIYDYVRGFAPLPHKIKSDFDGDAKHTPESTTEESSPVSTSPPPLTPPEEQISTTPTVKDDAKPEPPPIETIPVRKLSTDETSPVAQNITVNIISKTPVKSREAFCKDIDPVEDHIYEKVGKRSERKTNSEIPLRIPIRSNSAGKIFIPSNPCHGINKLFIKSPAQHRVQHKSRFFKHSKSSPALKDVSVQKISSRQRANRSKSLTTSPLFNIRYKSLTNLAIDFSTLDSSNSGGQTSSGSGGSKEYRDVKHRNRKLPRPKSLTNLFCEVNQVENHNKYNLMQNGLDSSNGIDNRKLIFSHEAANGKLLNGSHNKRIGTLYL